MIDIVTVIFGEELPIFSCQAQSIDLYCHELGIENIFVMVNEPELATKISTSWFGHLSGKVRVVPRESISNIWCQDGWLNQQALKIMGSAKSQNSWSMILDAKTVLTRPISRTKLLNAQGQSKLGWNGPVPDVFYPAQQIANELLESNHNRCLMPGGVPHFFHNASVRELINFVESKTKQDFVTWFLGQGKLTEFVLYDFWMASDPVRSQWHTNTQESDVLNICNICHTQVHDFDNILKTHNESFHTLSVHRRAWANLSGAQKQVFRDRLMAKGITRAANLP